MKKTILSIALLMVASVSFAQLRVSSNLYTSKGMMTNIDIKLMEYHVNVLDSICTMVVTVRDNDDVVATLDNDIPKVFKFKATSRFVTGAEMVANYKAELESRGYTVINN